MHRYRSLIKKIIIIGLLLPCLLQAKHNFTFGFEIDGSTLTTTAGVELMSEGLGGKLQINYKNCRKKNQLKIALSEWVNQKEGTKAGVVFDEKRKQFFVKNIHKLVMDRFKVKAPSQEKAPEDPKNPKDEKNKANTSDKQKKTVQPSLLKQLWQAPTHYTVAFDINDDATFSFNSFSFATKDGLRGIGEIESMLPELKGNLTEEKTLALLAAVKVELLNLIPRALMEGVQEELQKQAHQKKKKKEEPEKQAPLINHDSSFIQSVIH